MRNGTGHIDENQQASFDKLYGFTLVDELCGSSTPRRFSMNTSSDDLRDVALHKSFTWSPWAIRCLANA